MKIHGTITIHPEPFEVPGAVPNLRATVSTSRWGTHNSVLYLRGNILSDIGEALWYYMTNHAERDG